jgi:hypothetical protein
MPRSASLVARLGAFRTPARTLSAIAPSTCQGDNVLPLEPKTADIVALSAAGVALLALVVAWLALARARRLRRTLTVLHEHGGDGSLLDVVGRQAREMAALREQVAAALAALTSARADIADALRHVAVVRYDAFQDMGGRMSFSTALLDDNGDGIVLTAINGRSETRAYAKGVQGGDSDHSLSPEERQAIDHALRGVRRPDVAAGRAG